MKTIFPRFLLFFVPISCALAALVLLLYRQDLAKERIRHESDGSYNVDLHAEIIAAEFRAVKSDLLFLSGQSVLQDYLARPSAAAKRALAREYLMFGSGKGIYGRIRYLDAAGREVVRIDGDEGHPVIAPDNQLGSATDRYYFREALALKKGQTYVSPFDLDSERGDIKRPFKPRLRFAVPVFDASGSKRGVVVLDYMGAKMLRKLDEISAHLPGSLALLNGNGFWLRAPRREDEWAFMFARDRRFGGGYPRGWREIVRGGRGAARTDEGLFAFTTFSPVDAGFMTGGQAESLLRIVYVLPQEALDLKSRKLLKTLLIPCAFIEAVLAVLIWFLCRAHALRENSRRRLLESEARLRILSTGLIEAQERERKSLSRDLHDDLGQLLTAACLELERALLPEGKAVRPELVRGVLEYTRSALDRMREISSRLRPRVLDDLGLKEAARSLIDEHRKKTGIDFRAELRFESREVPSAVSENIYRILQEALNNVVKHARAKKGLITLSLADSRIELTVKDWGVGLDQRSLNPGTMGLLSMRERSELLGGTFSLRSEPGAGTEVRVVVPMPASSAAGDV